MLERLLVQGQSYDIDTSIDGFTNHLPMVLIALAKLGASDDRLVEYFSNYSQKSKLLGEPTLGNDFHWHDNLGKKARFSDYLDFYVNEIKYLGYEAVIHNHIDTLIKGASAAAFHALIRLSYGVIQKNPKEVAFGLAYMSSHYVAVPSPTKCANDPSDIMSDALGEFDSYVATGNSITERMLNICNHPSFPNINKVPKALSLQRIGELVSQLYIDSNNFTVLHGVTSCHAMRTLLPYIEDRVAAIAFYWSAVLAAVLSIKDLKLTTNDVAQVHPLNELNLNEVVNSEDDHLIKLVFSCIEEYKEYQDINHLKILNIKVTTVASQAF